MESIKNCIRKFRCSVNYCNANVDTDLDNMPRTDSETGQGSITDVAVKRRIRDYGLQKFDGVWE